MWIYSCPNGTSKARRDGNFSGKNIQRENKNLCRKFGHLRLCKYQNLFTWKDILKFNGPRHTSTMRNKNVSLEIQVSKNALSLTTIASDEMTFAIRMKHLGYMVTIAAKVIHLITCIPVEVK